MSQGAQPGGASDEENVGDQQAPNQAAGPSRAEQEGGPGGTQQGAGAQGGQAHAQTPQQAQPAGHGQGHGGAQPHGHANPYAGFWKRVAAILIDGVVFGVPAWIVGFLLMGGAIVSGDPDTFGGAFMGFWLFMVVGQWLYFAGFESSSWQATPGKRALSIKVTDLHGHRISFGKATGRHFGKILSAIILYIGFLMAGFTERKQCLHDKVASCLVVEDWMQPEGRPPR